MGSRKAQVTVFLIIGIVLLTGVVTVNFMRSSSAPIKINTEVPQELMPLKNYISQCVEKVATDGIKKIGKNGGYIGIGEDYHKFTKTNFKISEAFAPTESDGILFRSGVDWKIPYWHYFASPNKCKSGCSCASKQPPLYGSDNSIQRQLERYIDSNIVTCINLNEFKGLDSVKGGSLKSTAYINDEDVVVVLNYPIEAKKGDLVLKAENFETRIPVRLKAAYLMADELTRNQRNFTYLERHALTVLSSFATVDSDRLPPFAETELKPGGQGTRWMKSQVRPQIEELLSIYIPALSVADTRNFAPRYNRYALFILPNKRPDYSITVSFSYMSAWPIFFDLTGRGVRGEMIGPESMGSSFFSFIGVKRYNYYYDVSHPVLVRVHDSKSFNGKGFDLYFALESNIRNNREMKCEGPGPDNLGMPILGNVLCKEDQYCANLTLSVKDSLTGERISDADLSYFCGSIGCPVDPANPFNPSSNIYSVPQCLNGVLSVKKEGYSQKSVVDTYLCGNTYAKEIELDPVVEISVSLKKRKMMKDPLGVWSVKENEEGLYSNEEAIIMLEKVKENEFEEEFMAVVRLNGSSTSKIKLLPGNYSAEIMVLYNLPDAFGNNQILIPEVFVKDGKAEYTLPEMRFNKTFPVGMAYINKNTGGNLIISKETLRTSRNVRFYSFAMSQLNQLNHNDLEVLGNFEGYLKANRNLIEPVFS